jgi:hypothetical protein
MKNDFFSWFKKLQALPCKSCAVFLHVCTVSKRRISVEKIETKKEEIDYRRNAPPAFLSPHFLQRRNQFAPIADQ